MIRSLVKHFCVCLIVAGSLTSSGQEMWGISNSNFSGHMGIFLNPSTIVSAPYNYEINVVALDAFAENNYFFYPKEERIIPRTITSSTRPGRRYFPGGSNSLDGFAHVLVIGPSYIKNKKEYAWGIHSAVRSEFSVSKMSADLALLMYNNFRADSLYGVRIVSPHTKSAYASWAEIGGTYGRIFLDSEYHLVKWAINGNALLGLNGYYIDQRALEYTSVDSTQVIVHRADATVAHAAGDSFFGLRGAGLSTTIGATYINRPNRGAFECNMSNDKLRKYNYRLGVSLLDLGMIYYFNEADRMRVNMNNDVLWTGIDAERIGAFTSLDTAITRNVGGIAESGNFGLWLPLALSVQFDYQVRPNLFANLSTVNRLRFVPNQVARGNQVNVSVRYERRRYEASLNYSLFEYNQSSLGLGLRYRFFVIGSDRLLQTLGLSEVKAADFFFGIKLQFCKKPFSKGPDCPAYLSN